MIKVTAFLKLYKGDRKRQSSFYSGYRPHFLFPNGSLTSGSIQLVDKSEIYPGEECEVVITFISNKYLGDNFSAGVIGYFSEAAEPVGEIEIKEIVREE